MTIYANSKTIAIVTHAEDKGKYGELRFTTSRKDKKGGGGYVKSYFSFWKVVGDGMNGFDKLVERLENSETFANSDKKKGVWIVIKNIGISQERYTDKNGDEQYSKQPQFVILDWDFYDNGGGGTKGMDTAPVVSSDVDDDSVFEDDDDVFGDD